MFDSVKLDSSTKLVGRYPQFDKDQTYRDWNFCIDDPAEIRKYLNLLSVGEEVENAIQDPSFRIALVQGYKETMTWIINPTLRSAAYNGHTYQFDVNKIKKLSKRYPFDYKFEKVVFKRKDEYDAYLTKQKADNTFLFDYSPQFKFEGSFELQFPGNERFPNPKAISEYLQPIIEKIVSKNEFRIGYMLKGKNLQDQTQFTMTIAGSKKLFDSLQIDGIKKDNWEPTVETGWFFYRTK
jgi:hypothetical protein